MDKRAFFLGNLFFILGFPLIILVSFSLRQHLPYYSLGMPETVWFLLHGLVFLASTTLIYYSMKNIVFFKRAFYTLLISSIYAAYFIVITWAYVIETGVDSI